MRQGSLARLRHDHAWVVAAEAPEYRAAGMSGQAAKQSERPRRLTPQDQDTIRLLAQTRSLREVAAEFGVSHETVRFVLAG